MRRISTVGQFRYRARKTRTEPVNYYDTYREAASSLPIVLEAGDRYAFQMSVTAASQVAVALLEELPAVSLGADVVARLSKILDNVKQAHKEPAPRSVQPKKEGEE